MDANSWLGRKGSGETPNEIYSIVHTHDDGWANLSESLSETTLAILKPNVIGTVTEWAEGEPDPEDGTPFRMGAVIPPDSGQPKPGRYRAENSPVMREPQDWFSDPEVDEITWMIGAQVGKSRALQNCMGWAIEWSPGPIGVVYPNQELADRKREEDFEPVIEASPELRPLVSIQAKAGKRDKGRKGRYTFPGGYLLFLTGMSTGLLKGSPLQYAIIEEHAETVLRAPSNPDGIIAPRQTQFANAKLLRLSTPFGSSKQCPTNQKYLLSDQSKPFVCCPKCREDFIMDWDQIHFGVTPMGRKIAAGTFLKCPNANCGYEMGDAVKDAMLDGVRWRQTAKHECCGETHDPMLTRNWDSKGIHRCPTCNDGMSKKHRGGWASTLYAKGVSMAKLAQRWIDAQGDPTKLLEFINQTLAKHFDPPGEFDGHIVKELQDATLNYQALWGPGVMVPPEVVFLTMTVDIQWYGLVYNIRGHAPGDETYNIKTGVELAHPNLLEDPEHPEEFLWRRIDAIRARYYPGVQGRMYPITRCFFDIGDHTTRKAALKYIRPNANRGVRAIAGSATGPLYTKFDAKRHKQQDEHDVVGTDAGRALVDMRLRIKYAAGETPLITRKPGMMHWPCDLLNEDTGEIISFGYGPEHFKELTNFQQEFRKNKRTGKQELKWKERSKSVREEALDLTIYDFAAAESVKMRYGVKRVEEVPPQWISAADFGKAQEPAKPSAPVKQPRDKAGARQWKFYEPSDKDEDGGRNMIRATRSMSTKPRGW